MQLSFTTVLMFTLVMCLIIFIIVKSTLRTRQSDNNISEKYSNHDEEAVIEPVETDDLSLVIYDDDVPVIEIIPFEETTAGQCQHEVLNADSSFINKLSPIINQLPNLVNNATSLVQNKVVLVLKPEFLEGIKDGSLSMMKAKNGGIRLNVICSKTKKIVGQGSLQNLKQVNLKQVAAGALNIASLVVGQIHLAEINERLEQLAQGIESIRSYLNDERYGLIVGNLNYMKNISAAILSRALSEEERLVYFNQLEEIVRESDQINAAIEKGWNRFLDRSKEINQPKFMLSDSNKKVIDIINQYEEEVWRPYLMSLFIKVVALQILGALIVNRSIIDNRFEDIKRQMKSLEDHIDIINKSVECWVTGVEEKGIYFNRQKTINNACQEIKDIITKSQLAFGDVFSQLNSKLISCETNLERASRELSSPMYLNFELGPHREIEKVSRYLAS